MCSVVFQTIESNDQPKLHSTSISTSQQFRCRINDFTSSIVGRLGMAPILETVRAAAWLEKISDCLSPRPAVQPVQNAATKESPAAVVSMVCPTRAQGFFVTPFSLASIEPLEPNVISRFFTPRHRKYSATVCTSVLSTPEPFPEKQTQKNY